MKVHSKRYRALGEGIVDPLKAYPVAEAVALVKKGATAKFVESIDISIKLDIDTKQSDQLVRGSFALPHGTGKSRRVVAFAEGADAQAAKDAGAMEVGSAELVDKIQKGWLDFDVAVAHPSMMKHVGKLGKVLGPKGLMPSPKSGTVADDVVKAVREFVGGKLEYRNDAHGNVCVCVGNAKFSEKDLAENVEAFVAHIRAIRPAAVKGIYFAGATLSSTMGRGFKLAL